MKLKLIGNGVKRPSRPGASDRSDRLLLEPGLPPGGPRSAMTGTGVPCPRSTLEGRRAPRPCRLWTLIRHRHTRSCHPKTSSPIMLMDPFGTSPNFFGGDAQAALPALSSPCAGKLKFQLPGKPDHARPIALSEPKEWVPTASSSAALAGSLSSS